MEKSTLDTANYWLSSAENTLKAGKSLASTLYGFPLDIYLNGQLGAGKTTFLQGFAEGLGIPDAITSPTYALEQRYNTALQIPFIHIDLYRLKEAQAQELITSTNDHEGIRCIEWAEKLGQPMQPGIHVTLEEESSGRQLTVEFQDIALPTITKIEAWRHEVQLPPHIAAHCDAVANVAATLAEYLQKNGTIVRSAALDRACRVHDLLRFVDFHPAAKPAHIAYSPEAMKNWEGIRLQYPNMRHEEACATWLQSHNYTELGEIVAVHGLTLPPSPERTTIEQQLLFYADKRCAIDKVVTLRERFDDFQERYGDGIETTRSNLWYEEAKHVEDLLFPEGVPI